MCLKQIQDLGPQNHGFNQFWPFYQSGERHMFCSNLTYFDASEIITSYFDAYPLVI